MVVGKLRVKIQAVTKNGSKRRPMFDVSKLKTQAQREDFSIFPKNRFQALADLEKSAGEEVSGSE